MAISLKFFSEVAPKALVTEVQIQAAELSTPIGDNTPLTIDMLERAAAKFPTNSREQIYATRILGRLKNPRPATVGSETLISTIQGAQSSLTASSTPASSTGTRVELPPVVPTPPVVDTAPAKAIVGISGWPPGVYEIPAKRITIRGGRRPAGDTTLEVVINASGKTWVGARDLMGKKYLELSENDRAYAGRSSHFGESIVAQFNPSDRLFWINRSVDNREGSEEVEARFPPTPPKKQP